MKINILKRGDHVIAIKEDYIAVEHKSGEVEIFPLINDNNMLRLDLENNIVIGFGNGTIENYCDEDIKVITF